MIIDNKKLEEAILYVSRLCENSNPVTGERINAIAGSRKTDMCEMNNCEKSSDISKILNNADFLRVMYFVRSILEGVKSGELQSREKSPFPEEILDEFIYTEDMGITNLLKKIYAPAAGCNIKKLSPQSVGVWMRDHDYIADEFNEKLNGIICVPTAKGQKLGLYYKTKDFQGRRYVQIYYSRPAQEFVVKNFHKISDYRRNGEL